MTGDAINIGILNLWNARVYELLLQVHDSILGQVDYTKVNELLPRALKLMEAPLTLKGGRKFLIPVEAKTGFNWGDYDPVKNPDGQMKYKGAETRQPPKPKWQKRLSVRHLL